MNVYKNIRAIKKFIKKRSVFSVFYSSEEKIVLLHNNDPVSTKMSQHNMLSERYTPTPSIYSSVVRTNTSFGHSHKPLLHSASTDGNQPQNRPPMVRSSISQCSSLPPSLAPLASTTQFVEKPVVFRAPKFQLSEAKPSNTSISVDSAARRARYGQSQRAKTISPKHTSPCSIYMVDEVNHSNQELSSSSLIHLRPNSGTIFVPGYNFSTKVTTSKKGDPLITLSDCEESNNTKKRFILKKQLSEDVHRANLAKGQINMQGDIAAGLDKYSGQNRSLRSFRGTSKEGSLSPGIEFAK